LYGKEPQQRHDQFRNSFLVGSDIANQIASTTTATSMPSEPPVFPPNESMLIVSPHLDDAVFSCGALMAMRPGADTVTVFAGIPSENQSLTDWDALAGFSNAREAMRSRREEDRKALHIFSARPHWLDFLDGQYEPQHAEGMLHAALMHVIHRFHPQHLFIPAGLFHSDHVIVHNVMLRLHHDFPDTTWWMYEDALYRRIDGLLQERLAELLRERFHATPFNLTDSIYMEMKSVGMKCYRSQMRALNSRSDYVSDLFSAERYWKLEKMPA
jgi:LmbE family N-acetylglucosaminyl deacetylase